MSNPSYKQIIPADGWFFVAQDHDKFIVFPLAVWALTEDGSVIGLIGNVLGGAEHESSSYKSTVRLVAVPPIVGSYKRRDELSASEIEAIG